MEKEGGNIPVIDEGGMAKIHAAATQALIEEMKQIQEQVGEHSLNIASNTVEINDVKDRVSTLEKKQTQQSMNAPSPLHNPNMIDSDGRSKLHNASKSGNVVLVARLVEAKADVNLEEARHLNTPLHYAAEKGKACLIFFDQDAVHYS